MAPVLQVDLDSLQQHDNQGAVDGDRMMLPWRSHPDGPPARPECRDDQCQKGEAAEPAIGGKGVEIDIVRILAIDIAKLQRLQPLRRGEQAGNARDLQAEPPSLADIVVLVETRTHLEQLADGGDLQGEDGADGENQRAADREGDDAVAQRTGWREQQRQQDQERAGPHDIRPGAAREGEKQAERDHQKADEAEDGAARPADQQILGEEDEGRDEKRRKDIGIFEGALRPAHRRQLGGEAGHVEITQNGEDRRADAGCDIAAADDFHPGVGVGRCQEAEEQAGTGQIVGNDDEPDRILVVETALQAERAAEIVEKQDDHERQRDQCNPQAAAR